MKREASEVDLTTFGNKSATYWPFCTEFSTNLIGPCNTKNNTVVVIGLNFVKIIRAVCFEHNVQEFVSLLDYQNSFDMFLSGGSTDVQSFRQIVNCRRSSRK